MIFDVISSDTLRVHNKDISMKSKEWKRIQKKILYIESRCKNEKEFRKKMITRLHRIKSISNLYHSAAILSYHNYDDLAKTYLSKIVFLKLQKF